MKVFVATSQGQGLRESDIFATDEGELVFINTGDCGSSLHSLDLPCGCQRTMTDAHGKLTTTFTVADKDSTKEEYIRKLVESSVVDGIDITTELEDNREWIYDERMEILIEAAAKFSVGDILERRGEDIQTRPKTFVTILDEDY